MDEATAAIDDLESKLDQTVNALESERKGHAITRLQRDDALEMLECARADHATNTLELKEQIQLYNLRELADDPSSSDAEKNVFKQKAEEKDRAIRESQLRLRELEVKNRTLLIEMNSMEEKMSDMRLREAEIKEKNGGNYQGLRDQVVLLENEKRIAVQDYDEMTEALARLESDLRNPRLLSIRRAGQMQHIMYEIEDLEQSPTDAARLRDLHEELFNIFEDTLCYLKGGMIQLTDAEVKKLGATIGKCKESRQCINIFKEAHLSCKKIIVSVAPENTSVANAHWTISDITALDNVPDNRYMELLKNIRNLLVAHDMMDDQSRSKLSTFVEIMMNLDWLVILGHKAVDIEMMRKSKATRRSYRGSNGASEGSARATVSYRNSHAGKASTGAASKDGTLPDRSSDEGSIRSAGSRITYKHGSLNIGGGSIAGGSI